MNKILTLAFAIVLSLPVDADGPKDNQVDSIRGIPPEGLEIDPEIAETLRARCVDVRNRWAELVAKCESELQNAKAWQKNERVARLNQLRSLEAEVLVFPRSVELALEFKQFYKEREYEVAHSMLDLALRRAESAGKSPDWASVVGLMPVPSQQLLVGGYRSKIDGSYQPYAIVVPPGYGTTQDARPRRLDIWFHGRGETLSELTFLEKGLKNAGQYTPADTFVLHPYGRYSNAFKFAGEIDVLEALEYVSTRVRVNEDRIAVRGFSMGGAACWQFATRYAGRFFASNPGAGFSETPEFLKSFQGEELTSTPNYERRLWRLYDCPPWSRNLIQCPTIAYSGELDRQKQAADVMEASLEQHGIDLLHVIGPQTAHKIHPDSKIEIEKRMDNLARFASTGALRRIDFTTYSTRYHRLGWVEVHGLTEHWERGSVVASRNNSSVSITTSGVTHLVLAFDSGEWDGDFPCRPTLTVDGQVIESPPVSSDRSWRVELVHNKQKWGLAQTDALQGHRKRPGLQGPIDDAFLDSFVFVTPSGESSDQETQRWTTFECDHAKLHWRKHFRGDVIEVRDDQVTKPQIANRNLILFGDPMSNKMLARIAPGLPVKWTEEWIQVGKKRFPRESHAVAMIYPNPLNPDRYIVLNSGFTFREYDYLNNARQTPKLPDWAIISTVEGANGRYPGTIRAAGFFDEQWRP
ncbi:MAG: prolyl oligopeptidase family serine peptidase [Planctomycetota bacterium]